MKPINDQNIDDIMFQLLEGEITGTEREQLLQAIDADPSYKALWEAWQNTVLTDESPAVGMDMQKLKKKAGFIISINIRYAAAAALALAIGLGILFFSNKEEALIVVNPIKIRVPAGAVPHVNKDTMTVLRIGKDTFIPFKEKIRTMAEIHRIEQKIETNFIELPETKQLEDTIQVRGIDRSREIAFEEPESISPVYTEEISVTVDTETQFDNPSSTSNSNTLFARLFGFSKIKIEDDKNTLTKKKIVIENKKYQIIAGF